MKAIILAAGKGERLMPLTEKTPKPMIPINNKPVLEYIISLLKQHNITEIAINTSHLPEKIKEHFGDGSKFGVKLKFSFEPELMGTAGSLNNFRDFFNEPFFVIYGDNVTNLNLTKMLEAHKNNNAFGTMYLYHEQMSDANTTPGCVVLDEAGQVQELIENPNEEQKLQLAKLSEDRRFTNAGMYFFEKEVLDFIPAGYSDFAKQIIPSLIKNNKKIYGFRFPAYIREVGGMKRYLKAKEEIESGSVVLD